jgi:DNA-binding LacI/PurR family transcriptional regulator
LGVARSARGGRLRRLPLAARTLPTLTSLHQPIGRLADRAINLLTAKLANPRFETHVLERPQRIIRVSSSAT